MLSLQITSMKTFMSKLLTSHVFDIFLLEEASIQTATLFTIDGHIKPEFYPLSERTAENIPYSLLPWSDAKGICFQLIKGKYTPLFFKIVLQLKPEKQEEILKRESLFKKDSPLKALEMTIRYDGSKATITTGTSYHTFVMDKTADVVWDRELAKYLSQCQIPYEIL